MKRLFPYTHASAMRLWWNLVSLWYIERAIKAADLLERAAVNVARRKHLADQAGKRADQWDIDVQRMRKKK